MATRERRAVAFSGHPIFDWDEDNWRLRASCQTTDPELFFPVGTAGAAIDQIEAAKEVCQQCEVRVECLTFALRTNQESGVWGGTSEEERRRLRKRWLADRRRERMA
ncbi:MAG TPA: WhiB family transcriptional regulator [Acidimicrobiales bacterium]|nr:WhiB family transcriptional regulator [Acidimicrobiales bacterium]